MRELSVISVCVLCVIMWISSVEAVPFYFDDFNSYPNGAIPAGWEEVASPGAGLGPGSMSIHDGRWQHDNSSWCVYAYKPEKFGEGIYTFDLFIPGGTSYNNILWWRWDLGGTWFDLVFNTSPLIPPVGRTRLRMWQNMSETVLAEVDDIFVGEHSVVIQDWSGRIKVSIDGGTVFDVAKPFELEPNYIAVNPGDWGTGFYLDAVEVAPIPEPSTFLLLIDFRCLKGVKLL